MYICPICKKAYQSDTIVAKCFMRCWKEQNPNHKSKEAPRSDDIINRQCNNEMINFFSQFQKGE